MRGRTLNNAVIILDEAQNTTRGQMQMFLTRMGQSSKMIVTGDPTQIDLPDPEQSGLIDAVRRLRRTPGIAVRPLEKEDVVRHDLVQRIIQAYADHSDRRTQRTQAWIDAPEVPDEVTDGA
ncbi:MAG: PhoH family protein, partial [Phycisphaerales bacterium]|nr:PhoH family protein [Phycisphaerales bacterium]